MRFASAAAAALLPALAHASGPDVECRSGVTWDTHPQCFTSVIVVGAGVSGLSAARTLRDNWAAYGEGSDESENFGGLRLRVLEARDRVGGRAWTKVGGSISEAMGAEVDMGASWMQRSSVQDPVEQIADIVDALQGGGGVFVADSRKKQYYECGGAAGGQHTCPQDPRREACAPVQGCVPIAAEEADAGIIAFKSLQAQAKARTLREHQNRHRLFIDELGAEVNGINLEVFVTWFESRLNGHEPKDGPSYVGCFIDSTGNRDLPSIGRTLSASDTPHAIAQCSAACAGFRYMGLQWTSECFCGNSYGSQGEVSGCQNCGTSSSRDSCGDKNAVYSIERPWVPITKRALARDLFNKLDTDTNGELSKSEFKVTDGDFTFEAATGAGWYADPDGIQSNEYYISKFARAEPRWRFTDEELGAAPPLTEDWDVPEGSLPGVCLFLNGTIDTAHSDEPACIGDTATAHSWQPYTPRVAVSDSGCACKSLWKNASGSVIHGCNLVEDLGPGQGYCEVNLPCTASVGCTDGNFSALFTTSGGVVLDVVCANYTDFYEGEPMSDGFCQMLGSEVCCACGGGVHDLHNGTASRLAENPWAQVDTCTATSIVKDGCTCNVSSGFGWDDPIIQYHLSVLEKSYGTNAAHLSTRNLCSANRAFDVHETGLPWATNVPALQDCVTPFSAFGQAFTSCNSAGQLNDAQRSKSSGVPLAMGDAMVVPDVPNDGELWARCSVTSDQDGGWPRSATDTGTLRTGRQHQCVCEDPDQRYDGGLDLPTAVYKKGFQRLAEALRDGTVGITNSTDGQQIEAGEGSTLTILANQLATRVEYVRGVGSAGGMGVRVTTATGEQHTADKLILAVPLGVLKAGAIEFVPPLPRAKAAAIEATGFGNLNKLVLQYDNMFWPGGTEEFNIVRSGEYARGFLTHWVNMYPVTGRYVLVGYASGESADVFELLSDTDLLLASKTMLAYLFPSAVIPDAPAAFERSAWRADPLTGGSFAYSPVGLTSEDWGALAVPVDGWLWFAGEHLAFGKRLQGTVRGAFEMGREAALEMLSAREHLGSGFQDEPKFSSAATGDYQSIGIRYGCKDDGVWADVNGNGCDWYLALGCPGSHMHGKRREYYGATPDLAEVYGDYGQFQRCPVACDACITRKCDTFPCANDGACFDGLGTDSLSLRMNMSSDFGFKCVCQEGYAGSTCTEDVDECASDPCQNDATCRESSATPIHCTVSPAWAANNTELCEDAVSIDAYICDCSGGYVGETCDTCKSVFTLSCSSLVIPGIALSMILIIFVCAYKMQ
eukprot:SAG22_NODE_93_length_20834_cov_27.179503_16_plen_1288_part_00